MLPFVGLPGARRKAGGLLFVVIAGLGPAIPIRDALCQPKRDGRNKSGHDDCSNVPNAARVRPLRQLGDDLLEYSLSVQARMVRVRTLPSAESASANFATLSPEGDSTMTSKS